MHGKWYDKTPEQAASGLNTNIRNGLTRKEAAARLRKNGLNVIYPVARGSFVSYLKHIVTDFVSILLILTAFIAAVFHDASSATALIVILLINYAAVIYTYVRAHRVLETMGHNALPTAKVLRDGRLYLMKQEQLVEGDIIFLSVGDIVPADARLITCDRLAVLEAALTGETAASVKQADFVEFRDIAPSRQKNMVFASTIVTKGTGQAVVCGTGGETLVSKLDKNTTVVTHEKLRIHTALKKYCGEWSLCMILVIFGMTILDVLMGFRSRNLFEIFLTGLSLASSAMSEFYTAFAYIVIGCGIFNASRTLSGLYSGALIKNSSKLEVMKDVTCLVVPKEGIFSVHDMRIEYMYVNGSTYAPGDRKYADNCAQFLKYAVISTGLYGGGRLIEDNLRFNNTYSPEEEAILRSASSIGVYNIALDQEYPMVAHAPVSDENPFETTLVGAYPRLSIIRGEVSAVLSHCRYVSRNGRVFPMTDELLQEIRLAAAMATREAYRVVGVASRTTGLVDLTHLGSCQADMIFEGFMAIREPMLPGAAINVAKCREAGIRIIMLCDDVSANNRYLAESIGILEHDAKGMMTSVEMARMKEGLFRANLPLYSVYEGLTLAQKRALIRFLREDGEVVGVAARGLNEMPLLSDADVSFSQSVTLGRRKRGVEITGWRASVYTQSERASDRDGCEAVKFLSDVVISASEKDGRGGFNAIVSSLGCAKVIYLNLLRMLRYLIISQCARFFIVLFSVLTHHFLLTPVQILFCGLICDFMAVLVIAFERPASDILTLKENTEERLNHPLSRNARNVVYGFIWAFGTIALPYLLQMAGIIETYGQTASSQVLTVSFFSIVLTQIVVLVETMREKSVFIPDVTLNLIFVLYVVGILAFFGLCVLFPSFGGIFAVIRLNRKAWLSALALPLLVMILFEATKYVTTWKEYQAKKRKTEAGKTGTPLSAGPSVPPEGTAGAGRTSSAEAEETEGPPADDLSEPSETQDEASETPPDETEDSGETAEPETAAEKQQAAGDPSDDDIPDWLRPFLEDSVKPVNGGEDGRSG